MALLRLMMTMKSAYTSAEAIESNTPTVDGLCTVALCHYKHSSEGCRNGKPDRPGGDDFQEYHDDSHKDGI